MKSRDTKRKPKQRCEMCGNPLLNVNKEGKKYCDVCNELKKKIEKTKDG